MTTLLNYDLINISDAVTFSAPSFEAAVGAVLLVGEGWYAATHIDENGEPVEADKRRNVPLLPFEPVLQTFLDEHDLTLDGLISDNRDDIAATLHSFCTGTWQERFLYDAALEAITEPERRRQFVETWDDRRRGSLNQITNRAHAIAEGLIRNRPEAAA